MNSFAVKQLVESSTHELQGLLNIIIAPQDPSPEEVVFTYVGL